MLLIYDNQTQRFYRCKNSRTSSDHNLRPALPDFMPLIVPFTRRQMTVQHCHQCLNRATTETCLETLHRLWGK